MSRYSVDITLYEEDYQGLAQRIIVSAEASTMGEALALLDHKVQRAWVTLKQQSYIAVEKPDITNNIETK